MNKKNARLFWQVFLDYACRGNASQMIENPAINFNRRRRNGDYDNMPLEEYEELRSNIEEFQVFWKNELFRSAADILIEAMNRTDISKVERNAIATYLAKSSERSEYRDEDDDLPFFDTDEDVDVDEKRPVNMITPRAIYNRLRDTVWGQDEAKKAAATIYYNMLIGRRTNAIFCGPTGCGKSEIWRSMSKLFPGRIRIIDASRMAGDGWKGSVHVRDIFEGVPEEVRKSGLIVVLDEADKICCETVISGSGLDVNATIQNSLLKMLDGDVLEFGKEDGRSAFRVDCSRVSVVLLGAFEHLMRRKSMRKRTRSTIGFGAAPRVLEQECDYGNSEITYDDLINAGMRREIAGRMNRIVPLRPLGIPDYRAIFTGMVLKDLQTAINARIEIDDASVACLAERAASTGLGVRWMKSQLTNAVDDLIFEDPHASVYTVTIPWAQAPRKDEADPSDYGLTS